MLNSRPSVYVMPVGSMDQTDVAQDYNSLLSYIRRLDFDLIVGSPLNDEVSLIRRAHEVSKLNLDALIVVSLHGFTGHLQALFVESVGIPAVIWTFPTRYSFPTSASAVGYLRERGFKVKLVHGAPNDLRAIREMEDFIKVAYTYRRLRYLRIGMIGSIIPPMVASHFDRTILKDRLGVDVEHVPLSELIKVFNELSDDEVLRKLNEIKSKYKVEAPEEGVKKALKLYLAIRKLQELRGLDAIALECYTELFQVFNVNPCLGYVNDQIIGCEGEILNVIGLIIAKCLTGKPALISDPFSVSHDGVLTFMHCAAPASIAEDPSKTHVVLSEPPSIIKARIPVVHCRPEIPLTTVTIFRLYGKYIDKIHATTGTVVGYDLSKALQIKVKIDNPRAFVDSVVGNHYVIAFGDLRSQLRQLSEWLGIKYIET